MYDYADLIADYLDGRLIELFSKLKLLTNFDELNVINSVNEMFTQILAIMKTSYLLLAKKAYRDERIVKDLKELDEEWVDKLLEAYDATTKVVFINEFERKADRLKEAMISSPTPTKEVDGALRSLSLMLRGYTIKVTDEATLQAISDDDEELIEWVAEIDNRTCPICLARDNEIYPISKLPPKPHINCRCWFRRVR